MKYEMTWQNMNCDTRINTANIAYDSNFYVIDNDNI